MQIAPPGRTERMTAQCRTTCPRSSFASASRRRPACHFVLNALRGQTGEQRFHPGPANYRSWMPANGPRAEPACGSSPEHVIILIHRPPDESRHDEEKSQDNRHSDNAEYDLNRPRDPANLLPRFIHSVSLSSRVRHTRGQPIIGLTPILACDSIDNALERWFGRAALMRSRPCRRAWVRWRGLLTSRLKRRQGYQLRLPACGCNQAVEPRSLAWSASHLRRGIAPPSRGLGRTFPTS